MLEICQVCGKKFENKNFLSRHIIYFHKIKFAEYFWKYKLKLSEHPKCLNCGKETKYYSTKQNFCKYCNNKCQHEYETKAGLSDNIEKKRRKTMIENFGVPYPTQNEKIRTQLSETHKRLLNSEEGIEIKEKRKEGMLRNHGVEHTFQSKELRDKKLKTETEKYGMPYINTEDFKQKVLVTNLKKFGTASALSNKDVIKKKKQTLRDKYGTDILAHIPGTQQKIRKHYENIGKWAPLNEQEDFKHYKLLVEKYTRRISKIIPDNEKRKRREYHADHRFSIMAGFNNGILPWILCCPFNLIVIAESENCSKRANCSITKEELIENYLKTKDQYLHLFRLGN